MAGRVCRFLLPLVLAMSVRSACAEQLPLKIYTTTAGLASDRIRCILSDSHGFLWFGTVPPTTSAACLDRARIRARPFPRGKDELLSGSELHLSRRRGQEEKIFDSICNGASGYLLKKTPPAQIVDAVRQARLGGTPLSPEVAGHIVRRFRKTRSAARLEPLLTAQELYQD